ncbi:MAG TPA: class I SAM-dependent rRNA methyltransferase [Polyangiaceae bacterium LLY-WYZ-15_(1-7)]|nr:hypothetical protein [Sandaracinus sp.]MBJ72812.1 hypothetical protein [Sandaracinus sp.]HJL03159.1 class I SAM-dependent rRNA methyltransferase [Polyangiaceae bacterium LLY-WYZ-15_(1-7)]HJL08327.1 class I SAM-dependent rRNA methyltransferase [Polyangiaceae bacterium LLY-WYZ-15_(1-7)]HJL33286.1 class I SAM-dependent rRNA methyltransferase [Polyangiaceae bacterium LLY-WYZ-15_(1-7)]
MAREKRRSAPKAPRGPHARLAKPLERAVAEGHPWVFRDALGAVRGRPGEVATLLDRKGRFLARGVLERGPIGFRVWTLEDEPVGAALVARRIAEARALRALVVGPETSAYRLVNGEGDRMPGLTVDLYGDEESGRRVAVLRIDGAVGGNGAIREALDEALRGLGVDALLVRDPRGDADAKVQPAWGEAPRRVVVRERGMQLVADLLAGQKTGLFLDHRVSRARVRELAEGRRVLNLYAYTGGFSVAAGLGGARHVTTVDVAPGAIGLADESWVANGLDPAAHRALAADVPTFLNDAGRARWDLVVADPPSFAPSRKARRNALRAYAKLHESGLEHLEDEGLYLAASCSSHVPHDDFAETLREGARRARCAVQILDRWGAAPDHPRLAAFPEGDYLSVVLARKLPR